VASSWQRVVVSVLLRVRPVRGPSGGRWRARG
jgi:hypothetical protein